MEESGLIAYPVGFVAMIPFLAISYYEGPVAYALNGADLSVFVGFPVAALVYYVLSRSLDLEAERIAAATADAGLDDPESA